MRARIGTLSRRLAKVETATLTDDGELRGGVMLVPPIEYDLSAWEAVAMAQQTALSEACREDLPVVPLVEAAPAGRTLPPLPPGGMLR